MGIALDWLARSAAWLLNLQRELYGALGTRIQTMGDGADAAAGAIGFALVLGAIHAMTPGHGKAVIFSYFLGAKARPWSGIVMASKVAAMHVLSAILLVALFGSAVSMFGRPAGVARWIQIASYSLIVAIGVWLLVRALAEALRPGTRTTTHAHGLSRGLLPLAVGLLPCPLTMLILTYAVANASLAAGLVLTGFLGIGIAATIALVGMSGILARRGIFAVMDSHGRGYARALDAFQILSCLAIVVLGAVFLIGSIG